MNVLSQLMHVLAGPALRKVFRQVAALVAIFLPMLVIGLGTATAGTTVRFAPERDYGPFVFEAADGTVKGLSVDVLTALKPMLDFTIEPLPAQSLAQILEATKRGEVDLISSLRPTPERSAYLAFTRPYVQVPAVLVVRQSPTAVKLENFAGKRVAVGKGYAVEAFVRQTYPQVEWQSVPDDMAALQGLLRGEYQGVVADIASVSYAVQAQSLKGIQVAHAVGFEYPLSFAYRKELPAVGTQLESALLRLDPQDLKKIMNQWIDVDALHYEDPNRGVLRWVSVGVAALAATLLVLAYLRRRVQGGPT
jgi:ABC-type amino acid transport substrate-binding protein